MRAKKKRLRLLPFLFAFFLAYRLPAQEAAHAADTESSLDAELEEKGKPRQKDRVTSVLSFDLGWFIHGLVNNGGALGINYERLVVPHFSLRGMAGAMLFNVSEMNALAVDVTTSLFANWYPLSGMLDKLYAGFGVAADFLRYFAGNALPNPPMDVLISLAPIVGWKQNIANVVVLDFYGSYSFFVFNTKHFRPIEEHIRDGFQLGIRFKILWRPGKFKTES